MGPALIVSGSVAIAKLFPHPNKAFVPTPVNSVCKLQVLKTSGHLYFCSHFLERLTGIKEVYRAVIPYNDSLLHLGPLCHLRGKALELPTALDLLYLNTWPVHLGSETRKRNVSASLGCQPWHLTRSQTSQRPNFSTGHLSICQISALCSTQLSRIYWLIKLPVSN